MTQFALFKEAPDRPTTPSQESVRARIEVILGELKSAEAMPWTDAGLRHRATVIPQMCKWLPKDEAKRLIVKFHAELSRLKTNTA